MIALLVDRTKLCKAEVADRLKKARKMKSSKERHIPEARRTFRLAGKKRNCAKCVTVEMQLSVRITKCQDEK